MAERTEPIALCDRTAVEQRDLLARNEVSARELLAAHVERVRSVNPRVNAVVAMDLAVAEARAAAIDDARVAGHELGPLAGLVTAHKDLTDTADFVTTYGSPLHVGHRPAADSLLVSRMKAAGAVAIGKTNTPEMGAGSHTFNPVYGVTRNPWDLRRSAGGSSGGAAAALATGMVAIADGSDMGGSLRNPAAWNGVVGFRNSAGVVPSIGPGISRATFGVEGAMGRTVADLALLLSVLSVPDSRDPLSRHVGLTATVEPLDRPLRVAYSPTVGGVPVEPAVADVVQRYVEQLGDLGWTVELAEPDFSGADETFETIRSYLFANGKLTEYADRLGEVKATIREEFRRGRAQSGSDVAAAHAHVGVLWRRAVAFFEEFDLLIAPVTQISPFPVELEFPTSVAGVECERYIDWMRSACRITAIGMPALSLPAGLDDEGLPVGVQLVGGPHADADVLRAALTLEHAFPLASHPELRGSDLAT